MGHVLPTILQLIRMNTFHHAPTAWSVLPPPRALQMRTTAQQRSKIIAPPVDSSKFGSIPNTPPVWVLTRMENISGSSVLELVSGVRYRHLLVCRRSVTHLLFNSLVASDIGTYSYGEEKWLICSSTRWCR